MASKTVRRARTADRGPADAQRAPHYTVGVIGPKRKLRADGTLLCEDVPVARTGTMMYAPAELPMLDPPRRPGAAGVIHVTRDADTLFSPSSLGSLVGAAVTLDHPVGVDVTPQNRAHLARGFVLDAWRGTGPASDLMFADIVVTDPAAIAKVNAGLREVSLGYAADYEPTGDGEARQRNIVINHLALVERGRCGPRCAIGDRQHREETMPRNTTGSGGSRPRVRLQEATDTLRSALEDLDGHDPDDDGDGVHVHVHMPGATRDSDPDDPGGDPPPARRRRTEDSELAERVGDIEAGMLEMSGSLRMILERLPGAGGTPAPGGAGGAPTGDSGALATSWQRYVSQAEILVPGFRPPTTFDSALPRARTVDLMCAGRRQVLAALSSTAEGLALVGQVAEEGFDAQTAPCDAVATVFGAAAAVRAATNNRGATGDRMGVPALAAVNQMPGGGVKRPSEDEINKQNREFWTRQP